MKQRLITFFVAWALVPVLSHAQVSTQAIRNILASPPRVMATSNVFSSAVRFYTQNQYQHRWMRDSLRQLDQLYTLLKELPGIGLTSADYTGHLPENLATAADSAAAEVGLTLAALGIVHDIAYGKETAPVSWDGLKSQAPADSSAFILNGYLREDRLDSMIVSLEPVNNEYTRLRSYLRQLIATVSQEGFADITVKQVKAKADTMLLWHRLRQLLVIPGPATSPDLLHDAITRAQLLFSLEADGHPGTATLTALRQPLQQWITDLSETLNTLRWIYARFRAGKGIIVNIPSASLLYYSDNAVSLASKIIAGKPSTPTPTLAGMINEVILYPYWHVPYSIATRELLPMIKRNPGFINSGNYQLLDGRGRIVNPYSVNWSSINARNFPFVLRQSTGCDNALGWIKLNFDNPYTVYLHDTPTKALFGLNKRFFSHGCMRVEKAAEVARKVLAGNTALIDSLEKLGPLKNLSPYSIRIPAPVPVFVVYQRAWFDSTGNIRFCEDIYRRRAVKK